MFLMGIPRSARGREEDDTVEGLEDADEEVGLDSESLSSSS